MHQLIICVIIQTKRNKQLSVRRLSQYNQQWLNKYNIQHINDRALASGGHFCVYQEL
nr:MAG TPA: hypothetical protein [Caudoviricetes sp.]